MAATAAVMCQSALSVSSQLGVNPDSFLDGSGDMLFLARFLTPIVTTRNNTLILGPGGFPLRRLTGGLGLPLELTGFRRGQLFHCCCWCAALSAGDVAGRSRIRVRGGADSIRLVFRGRAHGPCTHR